MDMRQKALGILEKLRQAGYKAYWCGGCVRDLLRGCPPKDYDIVTNAYPEMVRKLFPRTVEVGVQFGVIRVLIGKDNFEIATFRRDGDYQDGRRPNSVYFSDEKEDALRRDFTINGLFLDPDTSQVIDYVGGQEDLKRQLIKTIGEPKERFQEDYLRLLRAVRFACQLNFVIEEKTWATVCEMAPRIHKISQERIRDELLRMLTGNDPARAFSLLAECGLLRELLPEVEELRNIPYNTTKTIFGSALLLLEKGKPFSGAEMAFAALFSKLAVVENDTSPNQEITSSLIHSICQRLKLPNKSTAQIIQLLLGHKQCHQVLSLSLGQLKSFLGLPYILDILELYRLQCATQNQDMSIYNYCQNKLQELGSMLNPAPLITGEHLVAAGFSPGPVFKEILKFVRDEQLEGKLSSQEEALSAVRKKFGI